MAFTARAVAIFVLLAVPAFAGAPAQVAPAPAAGAAQAPAVWKRVSYQQGRYSLEFPGEPKTQELLAEDGRRISTMLVLGVELDGVYVFYMTTYNDLSPNRVADGADRILLDARDGALQNVKGTLVSETRIEIDRHPGREFVVLSGSGDMTMKCAVRVFLVNDRLYQAMAVMPANKFQPPQARRFLDSFRLE